MSYSKGRRAQASRRDGPSIFKEHEMSESLHQLLADLHAERVRTWDPAKLQVNIDQCRELVETFDPSAVVQVGDTLPPFLGWALRIQTRSARRRRAAPAP